MTTTPHKHAELIKAWADGAMIQHFNHGSKKWQDCEPLWASDAEYRVKPPEQEKVYPETSFSEDELVNIFNSFGGTAGRNLKHAINYCFKNACDSGQIVTREEFDKCVLALQRIADIEDKANGGDWDEIEEARQIALEAISGVKP